MNKILIITLISTLLQAKDIKVDFVSDLFSDTKISRLDFKKRLISRNKKRALLWYQGMTDSKTMVTEYDAFKTFKEYIEMPINKILELGDYVHKIAPEKLELEVFIMDHHSKASIYRSVLPVLYQFENIRKHITIEDLIKAEELLRAIHNQSPTIYCGFELIEIAKFYIYKKNYIKATNLCYEVLLNSKRNDYFNKFFAYKTLKMIPNKKAFLLMYSRLYDADLTKEFKEDKRHSYLLKTFLLYNEFQGKDLVINLKNVLPFLSNEIKSKVIISDYKSCVFEDYIKDSKANELEF